MVVLLRFNIIMPVKTCHLCRSRSLVRVLDLGFHPLADAFLTKEELRSPEVRYPLCILRCRSCGHVMNSHIVSQEKRYQERGYSYDSGNSKVSVRHFDEMARDVTVRAGVSPHDLVVDIGSSVGTLLQAFRTHAGARVIGVDASKNIATLARKNNIKTIEEFWGSNAARQILTIGRAKVITATNCFNHIANTESFMKSVMRTLAPDGAFVIEVPYLLPLVEKCAFDTMYLEHVSYFAIKPLARFFARFGLVITDIQENDYMGGTIRVFVKKQKNRSAIVDTYIAREETAGLFENRVYAAMGRKVQKFKSRLIKKIIGIQKKGGRLIGIGAAAKGNTLLNYCNIDFDMLDFITDASPLKINKYTPGSHVPILPDEAISRDITHALILPWNIGGFLKAKLRPRHPHLVFITPSMK